MSFPKIEGYVVTEKLGSGSYSTVYKAYTKVGARSVVAIKCVDKSRLKHSGAAVDNLITEIRLLKTLTHPHIVQMKHFDWDERNIYIIMEYCCGGDLSRFIQKYGRIPEKQVLYFLQQLASALKFLREKDVVHMDLKPHNLLLQKGSDGKYILKVGDFGFAQYMSEETMSSVRGSPLYMAPEMMRGEYGASVDLWSVGVIMYECLFGKAPYSSGTFKQLIDKIQTQAPIEIPTRSSISPGCQDLLTRLLQHDPASRITYEEFFAHTYLDLEHMPSKENYEKAVALIKQAVELDAAGRSREAFTAYRDSLLYLVPVVNFESDAVRKSALTAKLNRYMQRAEELQELLRANTSTSNRLPVMDSDVINTYRDRIPTAVRSCCVGDARSTTSYDFSQINQPKCNPCNCTSPQTDSALDNGGCACANETDRNNGVQDKDGEIDSNNVREEESIMTDDSEDEVPKISPKPSATYNSPKRNRSPGGRFGLRRLFFGKNAVPYLDNNDSSITVSECGKKLQSSDTSNEVCRIS